MQQYRNQSKMNCNYYEHVSTIKGPQKPKLVKELMEKLEENPKGIWIRKLARELDEPISTVHKYVTIDKEGYPGERIEIVKQLPRELGGHIMIRLKR